MVVVVLFAACAPPPAPGDDDGGPPGSDATSGTPAVTFYRDLQPLLAAGCARCHGPDGLPPGDFLDPTVAIPWAAVMVDRIAAGEMPPPSADPTCHPYQDADRYAADPALADLLDQWIALGQPLGEPTEPPEIPQPTTLSRRDAVLYTAGPYTPAFVDGNEYRCFLIDDGVDADAYLAGIEALIDNPAISHHAILFVDPDGGSERRIEDAASASWRCRDVQPEPEWLMAHAWAPSGGAIEFPDGAGLKVTRGSQLVLQMHYFAGEVDPPPDQPGYALKLAPRVDRELFYVPIGPTDFVIPPGDPAYSARLDLPMWALTFGFLAYDVYGVLPHMHVLGTGYRFYATAPNGDQKCISRGTDYDFAMQPTYWFDQPIAVETDDVLTIECTWDNTAGNPRQLSNPPVAVGWGENTQQEMCYALLYVGARLDL
ncbi:MAG: hypothetical protein ABMB14_18345 [Myxococcota bacterium]